MKAMETMQPLIRVSFSKEQSTNEIQIRFSGPTPGPVEVRLWFGRDSMRIVSKSNRMLARFRRRLELRRCDQPKIASCTRQHPSAVALPSFEAAMEFHLAKCDQSSANRIALEVRTFDEVRQSVQRAYFERSTRRFFGSLAQGRVVSCSLFTEQQINDWLARFANKYKPNLRSNLDCDVLTSIYFKIVGGYIDVAKIV